jgi:predicted DNA binding protein
MTILVEFSIATDRFKLGNFIEQHDGLSAELERIVPIDDEVIPYVWVTGPPQILKKLTDKLEESEFTTSVAVLDELTITDSKDHHYLYRIGWDLTELDIVKGIINSQGDIIEGESLGSYWLLRFRFDDHSQMASFYQYLADNQITDFTIESIYELTTRAGRGKTYNLTPEQREALTLAAMRGYFDMPRDVTLEEIGDELDISQQAASQRVRRGIRHIVFDVLNIPESTQNEGTS